MYETYKTKTLSADKIALFGLFVITLLIAHFIIASRSAIILSEPIRLTCADLSVAIPIGNGWQSDKQWKYSHNTFTLSSVFSPGSGSITALARCRYLLAPIKTTPDQKFKQKAAAINAHITKTGQLQKNNFNISWAHIKKQTALSEMFLAIAQLPNNRRLDIEVHQATSDTDLAEQVFNNIAESLKIEDSQLLETGSEIVAKIKNIGINNLLNTIDNKPQQTSYLIKDPASRIIGFTSNIIAGAESNNNSNIKAASLSYLRGRYAREQLTFFQSDNSFNEFTWKNQTRTITGTGTVEITLDKNNMMTINKLVLLAKKETYQLGPAAMPEIFLDQLLTQMLDNNYKEIIVDLIEADGKITPTLISRKNTTDLDNADEETAYVLELQTLRGTGLSQQIYLNNERQILKALLHHNGTYLFERTNTENILREFPEHTEHLLQINKLTE